MDPKLLALLPCTVLILCRYTDERKQRPWKQWLSEVRPEIPFTRIYSQSSFIAESGTNPDKYFWGVNPVISRPHWSIKDCWQGEVNNTAGVITPGTANSNSRRIERTSYEGALPVPHLEHKKTASSKQPKQCQCTLHSWKSSLESDHYYFNRVQPNNRNNCRTFESNLAESIRKLNISFWIWVHWRHARSYYRYVTVKKYPSPQPRTSKTMRVTSSYSTT